MPNFCALLACPNRKCTSKNRNGLRNHKFPVDDRSRQSWVSFVNKYNRSVGWDTKPGSSTKLCEAHFEKECYSASGRLHKSAVPTKAPKFTAEVAHKCGLIPTLQNQSLLDKLNDFDHQFLSVIMECDEEQELPITLLQEMNAFGNIIDMPMIPLPSSSASNVGSGEEVRLPQASCENKENAPPERPILLSNTSTSNVGIKQEVILPEPSDDNRESERPASTTSTVIIDHSEGDVVLMEDGNNDSDEQQPLLRQPSSFDSMKLNTSGPPVFSTPRKPSPKKRKCYFGDISLGDFKTEDKANKTWSFVKTKFFNMRHRTRILQQQVRRARHRIQTLESMLKHLEEKKLVLPEVSKLIKDAFPGGPIAELLQRMLEGKKTKGFPPELTKFALTLNFHSPAAYSYVREQFMNCLPHPKTISKLYEVIDGSPGLSKEARDAVAIAVEEARKGGKKLLCSLMCDEMALRKQAVWTGSGMEGHADSGAGIVSDNAPLAKEAWVLMLVAVNGSWKIPVGYFFIHSLNAVERANLITQCLHFLHETGVTVVSLTFDGNNVNVSMSEILGAGLIPHVNFKPFFNHPDTNEKVYVLLDAAHMIKLWRNILASPNLRLYDGDNNEIKWSYLTRLHDLQEKEGLLAGNKLRKGHIHFRNRKMKVKLASQLLSLSVADALSYLKNDLKLPEFQGCEATIKFIKTADIIFDILNSKNFFAKKMVNKPLCSANFNIVKSLCEEAKRYILGLKVVACEKGRWQPPTSVLNTVYKTGFLGFLCDMESVLGLYENWVLSGFLKFIPTYKLSQDHLETFFCAIRSKGGWNNNPNVVQFKSAYKRLLVQVQLGGKSNANCWPLDSTKILNISTSARHTKNTNLPEEEVRDLEEELIDNFDPDRPLQNLQALSPYVSDVVGYIAGFVSKSLSSRLNCTQCDRALFGSVASSALIKRKNRGGLAIPSDCVESICKIAEQVIRENAHKKRVLRTALPHYIAAVRMRVGSSVFSSLDDDHNRDNEFLEGHRSLLISSVIKKYIIIRLCHDIKRLNESILKTNIRSHLTRTIIFQGQ